MSAQSAPDPDRDSFGPWGRRGVRLLDVDPDFASDLDGDELESARQHIILPTASLERGPWTLEQLHETPGVHGEVRGFLVLSGAAAIDLSIAGHVCTRLITPGELVLLDGWQEDSLPVRTGWTALEATTIATLDRRLQVIGRHWPSVSNAILRRAAQQVRHALLHQAIGQLPRVEDRLLALLWSIADRRGVVRGDGVWVHLPVTHATLARMIGARR